MEYKTKEQLAEEYCLKKEGVIKEAFLNGYLQRLKEERSIILNPLQDITDHRNFKWQKFNYGATTETDWVFGQTSTGHKLTFDEALSIPNFKLPSKESLNNLYDKTKQRFYYYQGNCYPSNHRAIFENKDGRICFYAPTKVVNPKGHLDAECAIWLSDECEDENKAWAAVIYMEVTEKSTILGVHKGRVLPPSYIEVDKTKRLIAHMLYSLGS